MGRVVPQFYFGVVVFQVRSGGSASDIAPFTDDGIAKEAVVSLVAVLLSDKLPNGDTRWGCLWPLVVMLLLLILAIPVLLLFGAAIMAFLASVADTGGMMSI